MVLSMTGFGKATGKAGKNRLTVEIRSLNSKSFELSLRLPVVFRNVEYELRSLLTEKIQRGKVDVLLTYESHSGNVTGILNREALQGYIEELKRLSKKNKLENQNMIQAALSLPGAIAAEQQELSSKDWKACRGIIMNALDQFQAFRKKEGKVLQADLDHRLSNIRKSMNAITLLEPQRKAKTKARLTGIIHEAGIPADANRLEQEMIFYIEKTDITEELIRLKSHCDFFHDTLHENTSNGKKLGFIIQEMNREINTIGSKANDATIQKMVVEMKDELEKMKEQTANIL